jgi:putative flippase GtrA
MPKEVFARLRGELGKTLGRYFVTSVVTTVGTYLVVFLTYDVLKFPSAFWSNFIASVVFIPPSYVMNRRWAWGRKGRSHWLKEVLPFWLLALTGLLLSSYSAVAAAALSRHITRSRHVATLFIEAANLLTWGVIWVVRFLVLHKFLFGTRGEADDVGIKSIAEPKEVAHV